MILVPEHVIEFVERVAVELVVMMAVEVVIVVVDVVVVSGSSIKERKYWILKDVCFGSNRIIYHWSSLITPLMIVLPWHPHCGHVVASSPFTA